MTPLQDCLMAARAAGVTSFNFTVNDDVQVNLGRVTRFTLATDDAASSLQGYINGPTVVVTATTNWPGQ